ncbi:MAG: hypothetical protein QME75_15920 [Deltaproteobacteria bacterium]|nr:hypothetical protein [Desulfitobacteriaceae bacterium]MDI6855080.1 hypothetical protein [Deltaproteobacteria bacterium]
MKKDFFLEATVTAAVLIFLLNCLSANLADLDLWGYLAFGRLFWESSAFPYNDVFSYTPTIYPWVYHEWLTGVFLYPLYMAWGGSGLQFLKYFLGLGTLALVYKTAKLQGAKPIASAIFLMCIAPLIFSFYPPLRAQVFTFFFFALYLFLLEKARLNGRWMGLLLLPALQLLWCNLHGGFLAGLGLIALFGAGEFLARRPFFPFLAIFISSLLVTLINPYGLQYWEYIARAVLMPRPHITEWASLLQGIQRSNNVTFLLIPYFTIIFFIYIYATRNSRSIDITTFLILFVTFVLAVSHIRHLSFFFFVVGAYLPEKINGSVEYLLSRRYLIKLWLKRSVKVSLSICFMLISIILGYQFFKAEPFSMKIPSDPVPGLSFTRHFPKGAVDFILRHGLRGNLLSEFSWGEYCIWNLYPQCLVAFDGRYETVYPEEVEKRYWEFSHARQQWRLFLESYPPDLILLDPRYEVADLIKNEPGWQKIYEDEGSVLFIKTSLAAGHS